MILILFKGQITAFAKLKMPVLRFLRGLTKVCTHPDSFQPDTTSVTTEKQSKYRNALKGESRTVTIHAQLNCKF